MAKIYVTGDCHHDFRKFNKVSFPEQQFLNKDDYVIICGDFGGVWNKDGESKEEKYWLDWLNDKPYTTLFVDGNHSNFNRLKEYEEKEWNGGRVHEIRPSVLHLMRGYVFNICGKKIFALGGASSHDIEDGILSMADPDFKKKKKFYDKIGARYRIDHLTWWKEELPNEQELQLAAENLEKAEYEVDYIITHCASNIIQNTISTTYDNDSLTDFLDTVYNNVYYDKWYFGHYHLDKDVTEKDVLLYDAILEIGMTFDDI